MGHYRLVISALHVDLFVRLTGPLSLNNSGFWCIITNTILMRDSGKTQFLVRAQGMPETTQRMIQRITTEFIWGKERVAMSIENVTKGIDQRGRKILDIVRGNIVIDLMWVKQYLNMGKERPKWHWGQGGLEPVISC